jgi:hypothetical protein
LLLYSLRGENHVDVHSGYFDDALPQDNGAAPLRHAFADAAAVVQRQLL